MEPKFYYLTYGEHGLAFDVPPTRMKFTLHYLTYDDKGPVQFGFEPFSPNDQLKVDNPNSCTGVWGEFPIIVPEASILHQDEHGRILLRWPKLSGRIKESEAHEVYFFCKSEWNGFGFVWWRMPPYFPVA